MDTTTLPPAPGRRAVLDGAHVGDIHGALGTVRCEPRHACDVFARGSSRGDCAR
jgi:hypothetical protein